MKFTKKGTQLILLSKFNFKDLEPTVPQEYILKGVVNAAVGQVIKITAS